MSIHHIKTANVKLLREESNNLNFRQLVTSKNHGLDLSVTWVEINGAHRRLVTYKSTRVYYLLEGSFTFYINSDEQTLANAGDVVIIPRSCPYYFLGSGKYLVINGPAFQENDDTYLP